MATRNTNYASAGGIGILIDTKAKNVLSEMTKWNNRILIVNFNGNLGLAKNNYNRKLLM